MRLHDFCYILLLLKMFFSVKLNHNQFKLNIKLKNQLCKFFKKSPKNYCFQNYGCCTFKHTKKSLLFTLQSVSCLKGPHVLIPILQKELTTKIWVGHINLWFFMGLIVGSKQIFLGGSQILCPPPIQKKKKNELYCEILKSFWSPFNSNQWCINK